jgi:hypothetical protein
MAFNPQEGSSSQAGPSHQYHHQFEHYGSSSSSAGLGQHQPPLQPLPQIEPGKTPFDIAEWYPAFQSCQRYFLDHAQYERPVRVLAAFMNIQLPYQKQPHPVVSSADSSPRPVGLQDTQMRPSPSYSNMSNSAAHPAWVSLTPYIRRMVATGQDDPKVLFGFFGEDWVKGVGELPEMERRNYLFSARSGNWIVTKQAYDISPEETCPFLRPPTNVREEELAEADRGWGEWLNLRDWTLGPRLPEELHVRNAEPPSPHVKRERQE